MSKLLRRVKRHRKYRNRRPPRADGFGLRAALA